MPRTHPPSLLTRARRTLEREARVVAGDRILVALSGGPDSVALTHALAILRKPLRLDVVAHGVDHGLRAEAARELDGAEALCQALGVPFARTVLELAPGSANLQARAREARHHALVAAARGVEARWIALGHHADDRAETFLMRLIRGADPSGLAVLPSVAPAPFERDKSSAPKLVRPLIEVRRREVMAHLERHEIPFSRDPSNDNPKFLRARVRRELIPLLETLNPNIVGHLNRLADQLAAPEDIPFLSLLRPTKDAMAELASGRGGRTEVLLPGGFVLCAQPPRRKGNSAVFSPSPPKASVGAGNGSREP